MLKENKYRPVPLPVITRLNTEVAQVGLNLLCNFAERHDNFGSAASILTEPP